ncbi:carbohydrate ABC transporter permease [Alkalibacterium pelagium]|jgi:multiple sugar transport system permease protein|uniref:Multiple sugar transport system permease protein n=1 Tax=Alkalibacterium pelagium TaxID=426702 RepID=A0A1H7HCD6_9LACT|nr:sugar ABC transporter permease [Alkalibacterium pelagium]SEK48106.1 multiple sugar transport system permease protein [Alkalibacterium pelagium]
MDKSMSQEGLALEKKKKFNLSQWIFIGPHFIFFIVFILFPMIYGFYASFTRWNLISSPTWVGLQNYQTILGDPTSSFYRQFRRGLINTLVFVAGTVPLQVIIPLALAIMLQHRGIKGKGLFQAIFYIPGLISVSAAAIVWLLIFNPRLGPVNNLLGSEVTWVVNQPYAWMVIFLMTLWGSIGGNLVIYRSAMSGISRDLYEAADIDGASGTVKFFKITIPMIKFPLLYTIVMSTAGAFNVYAQPLMVTQGGPEQTTHVLMMYIRTLAFGQGQSVAGMAAAMSILLGLVIIVIAAFQFRIMYHNAK